MKWRDLIANAELKPLAESALELPSLPADGRQTLRRLAGLFPKGRAAVVGTSRFAGDLRLTSYEEGTGSWYGMREVKILLWMGDLVVEGDLLDDAFDTFPMLVVHGDLVVRNWLRGGMSSFVAGSVRATGFVSTHYDDSALFVGGDLEAAGFIHHPKFFPDFPGMVIHQVAGALRARTLAVSNSENDPDLRTLLVPEVLSFDEEIGSHWFDNAAIFERAAAGLPVWAD